MLKDLVRAISINIVGLTITVATLIAIYGIMYAVGYQGLLDAETIQSLPAEERAWYMAYEECMGRAAGDETESQNCNLAFQSMKLGQYNTSMEVQ